MKRTKVKQMLRNKEKTLHYRILYIVIHVFTGGVGIRKKLYKQARQFFAF